MGELDIESDEELAALIALAAMPGLSPGRLWELCALGPLPSVWERVREDALPSSARPRNVSTSWSAWSATIDPAAMLARHRTSGVRVIPFGHAGYPELLIDDPDPPAVLFRSGPADVDGRVAVAIVGTRRCTRYGRSVAQELGAALAARGVLVVSGLAHGIDAAAHAGAAGADPGACIGVVASGLDVIYPRGNRELWNSVAEQGSLWSEWPLGATARPWRFPARNRLVAALSAAVVVVESGTRGGSLYTVDEALLRDRSVFAVPGSIHSPVSLGTNRLIRQGAQILCSIEELADALAPAVAQLALPVDQVGTAAPAPTSWLLDAMGWDPITLEGLLAVSGRTPADVTLEIERQIAAGTIVREGARLERVR